MHPYSEGGAYVNFIMDEGEERVKEVYADNFDKLASIKAKYDPMNLFRVNQNIKPKEAEVKVRIVSAEEKEVHKEGL